MKSIRFGADTMFSSKPVHPRDWIKTVQHIEQLGYSSTFQCDHFTTPEHDPIVLLSSAAAATKTIKLGTLVFDVDYRHPVVLARTAAALHLISDGRFEFGIGAGWRKEDYSMAGLQFDKPIVRIRRLNEALKIIRSMWTQEKTTFKGKYYQLSEMEQAGKLTEGDYPKIMVGGGGKQLLTVAGRHADIVGISLDPIFYSSRNVTLGDVRKRIQWVKDSARKSGRDSDEIEFQMQFAHAVITDDSESVLKNYAENMGLSVDYLKAHPQALVGTVDEMAEKLQLIQEETDVNYMVFGPADLNDLDTFAKEVIPKLS